MRRVFCFCVHLALVTTVAPSVRAQTAAIPPRYPAEAFGALNMVTEPQLSPSGELIAARFNVQGKTLLGTMNLATGKNSLHLIASSEESELNWHHWVSDDRLVIGIYARDMYQGLPFVATRMIAADPAFKSLVKLNWLDAAYGGDNVVYWPKPGETFLLMEAPDDRDVDAGGYYTAVHRVDLLTGRGRKVEDVRPGISHWLADSTGTVRLGFGYDFDHDTGRVVFRENASERFHTIDSAQYGKKERILDPLAFTSDPKRLIVSGLVNDRTGIYDYDISTGTYGTAHFAHPKYDMAEPVFADDGQTLLGARFIDDVSRTAWFDADLAEIQTQIDKSIGNRNANLVSMSADRQRMLFAIGNAKLPASYYIMDRSEGVLRLIARNGEQLSDMILADVKAVTYKARDGLDISGYLTLPAGRNAKNLPLILLPHGGPHARDIMDYDFIVQFLANRGYAVLQPNFRGSTGFGESFAEKGEGQWGRAMQDDLTDGVNWLVQQGIADAKRVCISGASYGGYAAMFGLVKNPELYRCAISFAGVSDLPALLRYDANFLFYKRWRRRVQGQDQDNAAVSPINNVDRFLAPLLLVHGKKDLRVPIDQSISMHKKMLKAGKTVEFVTLPEGDHNFSRSDDRTSYLRALDSFLTKYNPAD